MPETTHSNGSPGAGLPSKEAILAKYKGRPIAPPVSRRGFFLSLVTAWSAFAAAVSGLGAAIFAFMVPRVDWGKSTVVRVGPPDRFAPETVDETFKQSDNLWIVRTKNRIVAVLAVCTHLGCTPNWAESVNSFKCPCHGSGFRGPKGGQEPGINFEGPAPFPLRRCRIWLGEDGNIMVDKGQLYDYQTGQWSDPNSYLSV